MESTLGAAVILLIWTVEEHPVAPGAEPPVVLQRMKDDATQESSLVSRPCEGLHVELPGASTDDAPGNAVAPDKGITEIDD